MACARAWGRLIRSSHYFICMALLQLAYVSSPFGFDAALLSGIGFDARRRNAKDNITGILIARHDIYMQLLEGPGKAVEEAYQRIRRDDRHVDLRAVRRMRPEKRLFSDWVMRDDPVRSWLWTRDEIAAGAPEAASDGDIMAIFKRVRLSLPI